jgi:hypothetical protein
MLDSRRFLALFAAGTLLFGTAACSDTPEEQSHNNLSDAGDDNDATGGEVAVPDDWTYESEYSLRFTSIVLDEESPQSNLLNAVLETNIDDQNQKYPVVVLLHLKNIDPDANTFDLRGGAGLKANLECLPELDGPCDYKWDPSSSPDYTVGATFDEETGELTAELASLGFVATFESGGELLKSVIPLTDLTLDGSLVRSAHENAEGEVVVEVSMTDAQLDGFVTGTAAKDAEIQLSPGAPPIILYDLLGEENMNADLDGDGTNDAWHLSGVFSAIEATIVE